MRALNLFNLTVILASVFFTWKTVNAAPVKIHVIQNLTNTESVQVSKALNKLGFQPSQKELFSESKNAILITKTLKSESDSPSITIELMRFEDDSRIPQSLFQYRFEGNDVKAAIQALPGPDAFVPIQLKAMTMALGTLPQQK